MEVNSKNFIYARISERDGEFCKLCGSVSSENKLVVDSKTNTTTDLSEKFLICIPCLIRKRLYQLCVSERGRVKEDVILVTELQVSRQKEPRFRLYVYAKLSEAKNAEWEEQDLLNSGAEAVGISPTTAKRHLNKMCSSAGVLVRKDDGNTVYISFNMEGLLKR